MANISVTTICNKTCNYCFSREAFSFFKLPVEHMAADTMKHVLDFLTRSGINQVRLLGGEPTLHPDFPDIVRQILDRELHLVIFSNGLIPENSLIILEAIPETRLHCLINITASTNLNDRQLDQQERIFRRLGTRIQLGINIVSPAFQPGFMPELIEKFNLRRMIRLGLAHPGIHGKNRFLHPRFYHLVWKSLAPLISASREKGITLEFDCGFVPCMFPRNIYETLEESFKNIGNRCNPIPDILPDGSVIPCFPLADFCRDHLKPDSNLNSIRSGFEKRLKAYRELGIFPQCSVCGFKSTGKCNGGCLAVAIQRFKKIPFNFSVSRDFFHQKVLSTGTIFLPNHPTAIKSDSPFNQKETTAFSESPDTSVTKWAVPYIDQPLSFWETIAQLYGNRIQEVYFPFPEKCIPTGRPFQPQKYMNLFLIKSDLPKSVLINPVIFPVINEDLKTDIIHTLKKLSNHFGITSATVSDFTIAAFIRESLPDFHLTASVLTDIYNTSQIIMIGDIFNAIVASSRIMRQHHALKELKKAFPGKIRLIVNEGCLPGCLFRIRHFYEMAYHSYASPKSLCEPFLQKFPWMRLTGAWVLPQHLHLYEGLYDELKIAGRVTLKDPDKYITVLDAYMNKTPLTPDNIGGGPASVVNPVTISEDFFSFTLHCRKECISCTVCRDYWKNVTIENNKFIRL